MKNIKILFIVAAILIIVINIIFYALRQIDKFNDYVIEEDAEPAREYLEINATLRDAEGKISPSLKEAAKEIFGDW